MDQNTEIGPHSSHLKQPCISDIALRSTLCDASYPVTEQQSVLQIPRIKHG